MTKKKLTPSQNDAIETDGLIVLKACPGSGKTFLVANKIVKELKRWNEKNKGIGILSFTNVAHKELALKIKEIADIEKLSYPHYCGTIDGFLTQYIFQPFGHLIMNCDSRPSIIQDYSINLQFFRDRIWKGPCYRNACNPYSFYFDSDGNHCKEGKPIPDCVVKTKKPCLTFSEFCYKNGYATHNDVIAISLRVLREYPQIGMLLAAKFPMLIVDEAQDTSSEQMKIIDELSKYGISNIMLIGDPDQAIYEWRNADPSVFMDKYNGTCWTSKDLNINFRCSQNICNATKIFSSLYEISESQSDTSSDEFIPQIVHYDKNDKESLIKYFLDICNEKEIKITPDNVAVLVRGRSGLVETDYGQIKDLWKTQITKLLSEATYERECNSIPRALSLVSKALYQMYIDKSLISNDIDYEIIEKRMSRVKWNQIVRWLCIDLPSANTPLIEWKKSIIIILKKHSIKFELGEVDKDIIKIKRSDKKYPNFKDEPITSFYLKGLEHDYFNSTIHSVKGRTFKAVLLIIGSHGKLTSNMLNNKPIDSEEIRTAYVAMTRAKQVLILAVPKSIKKKNIPRFNTGEWDVKL